jgi:hypothetical protein
LLTIRKHLRSSPAFLIISVVCVVYLFCSTLFSILCPMTCFSGLSIQDYPPFSTVRFINQTSLWAWVTGSKTMYLDLAKIAFVRYLLYHFFFYVSKIHLLGLVNSFRFRLRSFSFLSSDLCFFLQNIQNVCISNPINTTLTDGSCVIIESLGHTFCSRTLYGIMTTIYKALVFLAQSKKIQWSLFKSNFLGTIFCVRNKQVFDLYRFK